MAKGAEAALTKGLVGSRTDQMMRPMNESTKNSMKKR